MRFDRNNFAKIGFPFVLLLLLSLVHAQEPAQQAEPGASAGAAPGAEQASDQASEAKPAAGASRVTSPPVGTTAGQSPRAGRSSRRSSGARASITLQTRTSGFLMRCSCPRKSPQTRRPRWSSLLHGFSGNHGTFMRTQCVDEAEKNGFILARWAIAPVARSACRSAEVVVAHEGWRRTRRSPCSLAWGATFRTRNSAGSSRGTRRTRGVLLPRLEHNRPHKEHSREPPRDAASHSAADVVRAVDGWKPRVKTGASCTPGRIRWTNLRSSSARRALISRFSTRRSSVPVLRALAERLGKAAGAS